MSDELVPVSIDSATAEVFHNLAQVVYATDDFTRVYDAIVHAAPQLVEGCDHASLMLRQDGQFVTVASSDGTASWSTTSSVSSARVPAWTRSSTRRSTTTPTSPTGARGRGWPSRC